MAAYSVTPPAQSFMSSSPLPVRGQSFKRVVSARGVSSLTPRLSTSASNHAPSFFFPGASESCDKGSELFRHFTLSTSRRSVASSPTESGAASIAAQPATTVSNSIVGFDVSGSSSGFQAVAPSANNAVPLSLPKPRPPKQGLLSRALTVPEAEVLPSLPEALAFTGSSFDTSAFFPDVDTTLLKDAQERHSIFFDEMVSTAYMLAAKAYNGALRKDGTTILSHGVMTALQLANIGLDAQTVAAGLLHDVLRHNEGFRSQLEEFMPREVVQLVDRVSTISEISQLYRNHRDIIDDEKLCRMLVAMEDVKAMLVKLACRVHDMKTLSALPYEKQLLLADETLEIFSVVANRLGIWCLKAELEDLAFSVLHPEEYQSLKTQVATRQNPEALEATISKIKTGLDARGVRYEDISGRPKNLYGIWQKMKAGNIKDLSQIYDVTALRVIVANKHDCYVALRVIQESYRTMPNRSKDYIKDIKKPNGYQSLHETIYGDSDVPMEAQIRTHKMHYIAEYGLAAHWKYKEKLSNEDEWLDKEVQYKKWLTNYKLGVHDKKVRANGSPPTDGSLKSLGVHYLGTGHPEVESKVDPFLMHDRFKLQQPDKQAVSVVLQTQDTVETRELPAGCTALELSQTLGVHNLPGYMLTVNKLPAGNRQLQTGDLVQVVPVSRVLSRSAPDAPAYLPGCIAALPLPQLMGLAASSVSVPGMY